jgi:hypothetical protein
MQLKIDFIAISQNDMLYLQLQQGTSWEQKNIAPFAQKMMNLPS